METPTQTTLVLAAQAGDQMAFETLVGAYRRELLVHCYRMLGSLHDAEDLVQETLLRAWEKRATLTSPGAYRAWLYRIATNLCLNTLTRVPRRSLPPDTHPVTDPTRPLPPRLREPIWLEPFPDDLLADQYTDPEDHALQRERITLAFLVALQHLTPAQRAILLLREVLDWPASEVAEWLNLTVPAVNSALQRARRTLQQLHMFPEAPFVLASPQLQTLLDRYVALWEQADIPGLVALLREDAWFTMPPTPGWFQGRVAIATFFRTTVFTDCFQRVPMPARHLGCTGGMPRRGCIGFLACWSWGWWASRLQTRSRSWNCPASRSLRCLTLSLPRLLALFPATQRKAIPGILIRRNAVSIGISKDEGAPERTIIRWLDDGSAFRFQFGMQLIDLIAVDPERHPPSRLRCFIQVHFGFAERKGDRVGIKEHKIGGVEALIDSQAQQLCVERARGGEIAHLQADKIRSKKFCHACSFLLIKIECNSDPIVKIVFTRYPLRAYQQPPLRH